MSSTLQPAALENKDLDTIKDHLKNPVEFSERSLSVGTKSCSRHSSQSRRNTNLPTAQSDTMMHGSDDSIRPLRKASDQSEMSEKLPTRPDPVYARSPRTSMDPEKQAYAHQPNSTPGFTPTVWPMSSPSQPSMVTNEWNCEYVPEQTPPFENHLGVILLHLSIVNPLFTMVLSFYTISSIFCFALIAPLSLCTSQRPFRSSIISSISPVIRLQLRMVYSYSDTSYAEHASNVAWSAILAPFYAMAICFAAWVAASFWLYASILGEPNERQGEEQEGKAAIRAVRRLWERWLLWGLS